MVDIALQRGFELTAFGRSPHKLTVEHARLTKVRGDPQDHDAMAAAMRGHDAIIMTLGPTVGETLGRSTRMEDWGRALGAAITASGVHRAVVLSAGVLFPLRGAQYAFFRWLLRHHARDLVAMEGRVAAASQEYTFVRPPRLIDTPNDAYVVQEGSLPTSSSSASFRAVASFMVDAVEARTHVGQVVGLVGTS